MAKDEKFSMRLPADLKVALQRRAEAETRSLAGQIVHVLSRYVEETPEPGAGKAAKKGGRN
ncbi:MAG: ribbon-helix-helix domain-containing protein [Solimonas sp.]